ncbi:pre-rRNA-processing protein TSR2 isoform X3 [Canna indica]|uniref:Pre-rRNA-processing protein TSR2 isoform X3 n=1 Tax=Canna indica TaxID=4628 RepID=A0AAQ3K6R9_9LILI|nr:pre-rRNA-processing protein TSR2 isoform X3 [Canna indica]
MDSYNGMNRGAPSRSLSPESLFRLSEGISLVLSRWAALQVAIRNEWGGEDSRRKYDEFASTLLSLFSESNVLLSIDDLESALEEKMVLTFNTMVDDGSVEEIAEQLMLIAEECIQQNYEV